MDIATKYTAILLATLSLMVLGCQAISTESIEEWIRKEIPLGSTKDQVVAVLDKEGIEHSAHYKPELYYNRTRTINAKIPNSSKGVLVHGDIFIDFEFSEKDILENYKVEEIMTGL